MMHLHLIAFIVLSPSDRHTDRIASVLDIDIEKSPVTPVIGKLEGQPDDHSDDPCVDPRTTWSATSSLSTLRLGSFLISFRRLLSQLRTPNPTSGTRYVQLCIAVSPSAGRPSQNIQVFALAQPVLIPAWALGPRTRTPETPPSRSTPLRPAPTRNPRHPPPLACVSLLPCRITDICPLLIRKMGYLC
jgi:hypothetical protein